MDRLHPWSEVELDNTRPLMQKDSRRVRLSPHPIANNQTRIIRMTATERPRLPNAQIKDIRGVRFGRLLVQEFDRSENGRRFWLCVCDCGKTKIIDGGSLKRGHTTSCGCVAATKARERVLTHGMTHSAEFRIWTGMKDRTTNPKCHNAHLYSEAGVRVCERWQKFENFYADMGPRPSKDHSIDRFPDKNGHYEPANCRWATRKEQGRNKRNNDLITFNGETMPRSAWTERLGFKKNTLRDRIVRAGWSVEYAMTTPEGSRMI